MDVIINNATPAQVVPQTYTPYQTGPQGFGFQGPGYSPGFHGHDGPGFFPVLLLIGAVLFFRRRMTGRHVMNRRRELLGHGPSGRVGDDMLGTFRRGRERFFGDGALDIARERYARGEINADEYETLRRTLSGDSVETPRPGGAASDDGGLKL